MVRIHDIETHKRLNVACNRIFCTLLGLQHRTRMSENFIRRGLGQFKVIVRKLICSFRNRISLSKLDLYLCHYLHPSIFPFIASTKPLPSSIYPSFLMLFPLLYLPPFICSFTDHNSSSNPASMHTMYLEFWRNSLD